MRTDPPGPASPRPDFFIVGAPKCGTTALYEYLRQHPAVFMPFHKEPLYFGEDLTRRYGRMTLEEYEHLFSEARPGQRIGEASAWYLYSMTAAAEIRAYAPEAQIIVMVRNPVDMMYAEHSQVLFNRQEDLADFAVALAAEEDRRRGRRLPPGAIRKEVLFYRHSARFADQLDRYIEAFGRERIHVIVYDDLIADTQATFRGVCAFLGIDPDVAVEFGERNANKRTRSAALQRLIYQPPPAVLRLVPMLRRFRIVHWLRGLTVGLNSRVAPRPPLDPALRRALTEEFRPQVERLSHLIGRDLSAWTIAAEPA